MVRFAFPIDSHTALTSAFHRLRALLALAMIAFAGFAFAQSTEPSLGSLWASKEAWDAKEPWRTDRFYVLVGTGTIHFNPDDDHKQSWLLDLQYRFNERWLEGQWIAGLALFTNSFGQFSQYAYGGLQWRPLVDASAFLPQADGGRDPRLPRRVPGQVFPSTTPALPRGSCRPWAIAGDAFAEKSRCWGAPRCSSRSA